LFFNLCGLQLPTTVAGVAEVQVLLLTHIGEDEPNVLVRVLQDEGEVPLAFTVRARLGADRAQVNYIPTAAEDYHGPPPGLLYKRTSEPPARVARGAARTQPRQPPPRFNVRRPR